MVMNNIIFSGDVELQSRPLQLHSNDDIIADANENCYKNFRMSYRCWTACAGRACILQNAIAGF